MGTQSRASSAVSTPGLPTKQVYGMAAICLLLGLFVGYFFLAGPSRPSVARTELGVNKPSPEAAPSGAHPKLTLDQMKQMADVQASTLIEKSKADPKNASLLVQIASIYQATHQFKEAAGYFEKALKIDPKNVSARTELASCLYYSGDADAALSQLNQALKYKPTDANCLFNLGMIKYRGKNDVKGAIAAWQELLRTNPNLDRRPDVEKLIAEAKASPAMKNQ
ncbi:MAG TPA: tetratricopeptide repeat protein [Candidatus Sulfotelmatobacter sp.]|nr:tetratricopeptide repeat protein [Candidatus Sulfotelmatobacter sp.]